MEEADSPTNQAGEQTENQTTPCPNYSQREFFQYQIQDTLYRLPSNVFRGSPRFQAAMRDAYSSTQDQDDDSIITLTNVTTVEMDNFLKILTAKQLGATSAKPFFDDKCLLDTLRLAALWDFAMTREFAIRSLESRLGEVDVLALLKVAKEAKLPWWLSRACERLCERIEPLTDEESKQLGLGPAIAICRIREKRVGAQVGVDCGSCSNCKQYRKSHPCMKSGEQRDVWAVPLFPRPSADELTLRAYADAIRSDMAPPKLVEFAVLNAITASPHAQYYLSDESLLAVQVDHELYWLPKALLTTSKFFRPMVDRAEETPGADGVTEKQPIIVTDVSASEMSHFLDLITASLADNRIPFTTKPYTDALHVASKLQFLRLGSNIIRRSQSMSEVDDPIDILDVGYSHNVPEYVNTAYLRLCKQDYPFSAVEGARLGHERLAAISRVRYKRTHHLRSHEDTDANTMKLIREEADLDVPAQKYPMSTPLDPHTIWMM
ncbi:hypothetical protein FRB99_003868 [Tulasnella sp. 403]|nr:hypothetical protein FRB99_003868 [Tulasnella sp. 403]